MDGSQKEVAYISTIYKIRPSIIQEEAHATLKDGCLQEGFLRKVSGSRYQRKEGIDVKAQITFIKSATVCR